MAKNKKLVDFEIKIKNEGFKEIFPGFYSHEDGRAFEVEQLESGELKIQSSHRTNVGSTSI